MKVSIYVTPLTAIGSPNLGISLVTTKDLKSATHYSAFEPVKGDGESNTESDNDIKMSSDVSDDDLSEASSPEGSDSNSSGKDGDSGGSDSGGSVSTAITDVDSVFDA